MKSLKSNQNYDIQRNHGDIENYADPRKQKFSIDKSFSTSVKLKDMNTLAGLDDFNDIETNLSLSQRIDNYISSVLFPGIPVYYPLKKKIQIIKSTSFIGALWDFIQISCTFLTCSIYVASTYHNDLITVNHLYTVDIVIAVLFTTDTCLNFYLHSKNYTEFFMDYMFIVNIITVLPTYLAFGVGAQFIKINILKSFRIVRLIRIVETFAPLRKISNVKRQLYTLVTILIILLYVASCLIQLMENDLRQLELQCQYINAATSWQPSCNPLYSVDTNCDCNAYNCRAFYLPKDVLGEPNRIRCQIMTFYNAFYFCLVTIGTVGFGDVKPYTYQGKALVIILIISTAVLIPIHVGKLQLLMSLRSQYRKSYIPVTTENHVILCGYVNNAAKLLRFFSEFYHPDRMIAAGEDFSVVILCPNEPLEEVKTLIQGPSLAARVTYIQGSALSTEDLKRVSADTATAMFFLCNVDSYTDETSWEDSATVLRALSVSNFTPYLDCLVQVIGSGERKILKDSDVDVILCFEEFRIALQARNAICPGFSTFLENAFHSFESIPPDIKKSTPGWYQEYLHGAGMEFYFIPLSSIFLEGMRYSFRRMAVALFAEYGKIIFAVTNNDRTNIVFNPTTKDLLDDYSSVKSFFLDFNVGMIMAEDQNEAEAIAEDLQDPRVIKNLKRMLWFQEQDYPCRPMKKKAENPIDITKPSESQKRLLGANILPNNWLAGYSGNTIPYMSYSSSVYDSDEEEGEVTDDEIDRDDFESTLKLDEEYVGLAKRNSSNINVGNINISGLINLSKSHDRVAVNSGKLHPRNKAIIPMSNKNEKFMPSIKESIEPYENPALDLSADMVSILQQSKPKLSFTDSIKAKKETKGFSSSQFMEPATDENGVYVLGSMYSEINDANKLSNHVIISGSEKDMHLLLKEMRKPSEGMVSYHQLLLVTKDLKNWDLIRRKYHDVYFIKGNVTNLETFSKINISKAYSLIFLGSKTKNVTREILDAPTLFAFLKISHLIPSSVYCCVELNSQASMAVLNTSITRKRAVDLSKHLINDIESPLHPYEDFDDDRSMAEIKLWEFTQTYHAFPAYAAARALLPSSFEFLIVQSFYVKLTPIICEKLICGQLRQTCRQINTPAKLEAKKFIDAFRYFLYYNCLCFGLLRAPQKILNSDSSYVFISPPIETIIFEEDKIFLYGTSENIFRALEGLKKKKK